MYMCIWLHVDHIKILICLSHINICDFHASNKVFLCLQSLSDLARLNDGRVVCPRTKEIFHLDEAEKVFVM